MQEPVISIVLPTYNGSRYIAASIESCLSQTFAAFELIIVNDCSTDNTPEIIEAYAKKDDRIRVIHNKKNKKLPLSLNTGFENAQGKYFTWTSDDNYYAPEALQAMYNAITADQQTDLVYCDYTLINDNGEVTGEKRFNDVNKSFFNWLGCGACFLYKAEVHTTLNGYNPAAFLIEDYEFFIRAWLKFQFKYLPDTKLYYYREHAASLTNTQRTAVYEVSKISIERLLPGLEKKLSPKEFALMNRKYAVYYGVMKNNAAVSSMYLRRLAAHSKMQVLVTVIYIAVLKFYFAFKLSFTGLWTFLKSLFGK